MRIAILIIIIGMLLAAPASAQVPISDTAKMQFQLGVAALEHADGPKYRAAYEAFRKAYDASPSPKILSNLGLAAMAIERDGEAIDAYETYLNEVDGIDPRERQKINKDLAELRARSATIALTVLPVGGTVIDSREDTDDGVPVVNKYKVHAGSTQLVLRAGVHNVKVEAEGHSHANFEVVLEPGDKHVERVELVPDKPKPPRPDPEDPKPQPDPIVVPDPEPSGGGGGGISGASIAMIVVTAGLGIGAAVVGGLAVKAKSDYETYERGGSRTDAEDVRATGEALNITTDVLIGLAAASAVVTVVLLVTTTGSDSSAKLTVRPAVGGGMIGLEGNF